MAYAPFMRQKAWTTSRTPRRLYTPVHPPGLRSFLRRFSLVIALILIVVLVVYFEGGLRDHATGQQPTFLDSIYFAMVTITTVGYGDIVPVNTFSRLVDAFLLTPIRFIVIFVLFGSAYEVGIAFREEYRMRRTVGKLNDHVVICGFGATGQAAAKELRVQGVAPGQIVVIADDEASLELAAEMELVAVRGDASREAVLQSVAVDRAAHVLVCPGRDDTAVLIALTVRHLNPNAQLVAACRESENIKLLQRTGADRIVSPPSAGGTLMASATRHEHIADTLLDLLSMDAKLHMAQRKIVPGEVGKHPRDLLDVVVRVYRGDRAFNIGNFPTLESGDTIVYVRGAVAASTP